MLLAHIITHTEQIVIILRNTIINNSLRVVINGPFLFAFCRNFTKTRIKCGPIIMFHEVVTLVHLIESSKPEVRAKGIRLIVLLEVP